MNAPCKDCPCRHVGCHSTCEKYQAFRRERDAVNRERNIDKMLASTHVHEIIMKRWYYTKKH